MKIPKILIICILLLVGHYLEAQTQTQNYVSTTVPYQIVTNPSLLSDNNANTSVQYYDGLGRLIQTVQRKITPTGNDLVSGVMYDNLGRDSLIWLPGKMINNNGAYVNDFMTASISSNSDPKPYGKFEYESSPLNRVTGKYGAGNDWHNQGKKIVTAYTTNTYASVKKFAVVGNHLACKGYYDAGTLYGQLTTDEDGKTVEEFTNKQGEKVLSRGANNHDTYFVYDDNGYLCYVLPPLASDQLSEVKLCSNDTIVLKQYAYLYRYDFRGRNVMKRLPGCDSICMIYDKSDRLVASQDGLQRMQSWWTVNRYDKFNRLLYSFIATNNLSTIISVLQDNTINEVWNNNATTGGYSLMGGNTSQLVIRAMLNINYYDTYTFMSLSGNNPASMLTCMTVSGYTNPDATPSNPVYVKTMLIGTRVYHLDDPTKYEVTALYYDKYGRTVQTRASNHLGGYDIVCDSIDFLGKPTKTLKTHSINGTTPTVTELYRYTYDKAQRLVTTSYSLNGATAIQLAINTYDDLGQLITKTRHNRTEDNQYTYNIRNWPTKIKSGTFEENLYYFQNLPSGSVPCYNGNIAYSTWTYNGVTKGYQYTYDNLNRLTASTFKHGTSSNNDGDYNETYAFDKMGNVTAITRMKDGSLIDNLDMSSYKGNQLRAVTDYAGSRYNYNIKEYQDLASKPDEFYYDANGNMHIDLDRNIVTIRYNVLNLPEVIQFKNGNQIKNSYDASGKKLGEEYFTQLTQLPVPIDTGTVCNPAYAANVIDQSGYAYIGNYEYNTSHGDAALTTLGRIYNDEGYVENPANPQYYYYRRDHLSDNREVWLANTNSVVQRTQYYPSGLPWAYNTGDNPGLQRKKYNNKAFIEMHGYDTYDIEWRQYYPAIMRFQTPDPEIEDYYGISPYSMCGDNMILHVDPDGRDFWDFVPIVGSVRDIYHGIKKGNYAVLAMGVVGLVTDVATFGESSIAKGAIKSGVKEVVKIGVKEAPKEVQQVAKVATKIAKEVQKKEKGNSIETKKTNPKKEAREAAKEKRENQPGSEKRAKDYAKSLEKREGKDARRNAHDAKEKGTKDRTVNELKEDYKQK
jgi:RHS repeat-associated protein